MTVVAVVRIKGNVGIDPDVEKTLQSLNLRKAFTAALFQQSETIEGMLHKAQRYLTWGKPNKETIFTLLKRSGSFSGDLATLSEKLEKGEEVLQTPVYVQLRPPKKGFKGSVKRAYKSKGEYGDRADDINELIRRMV
ncbi:MAG: uL30 family ribosomal protein [Candidatus Caldarchaeum sp.]|nr:uL30 family ribosomal protein [Candidatus Caldarchaeum sp.]